jgi:hypothetical protein
MTCLEKSLPFVPIENDCLRVTETKLRRVTTRRLEYDSYLDPLRTLPRFQVLVQFEITAKAFANFSSGLELATTLGHTRQKNSTLQAWARLRPRTLSALGSLFSGKNPGLKQPWAEICERLRRIFKLNQYA